MTPTTPSRRANGRWLAGGLIAVAVVFGAALWYFQTYAFYETVTRDSIEVAGKTVPVTDYLGIDASSSPLKRRGCFLTSGPMPGPVTVDAIPLTAPDWFDCFDARSLTRDIASGAAVVHVAAVDEFDGVDRLIAVYPDGRAYEWRQLNAKFRD